MPRKRRKLNPEMELKIKESKRKLELILAIINDIEDESIQGEYAQAFEPVKNTTIHLASLYDEFGFCVETQEWLETYNKTIEKFESEFEI